MLHALLNLFFPACCAGCEAVLLTSEKVICTRCRHELPQTGHYFQPQNEAAAKFYGRLPVETVVTFLYYHKQGIVQQLIEKLKYKSRQEIGEVLGLWFSYYLKQIPELKTAVIIPVPLHPKKLRQRGYNQVTTYGKSVAAQLGIPYQENILYRKLYSKTQTKKGLLGRNEIKSEIFGVKFTDQDHGKHFLIIDDVLTTGATLEACGRALLEIPGAKISIACLAFSKS